ncbi:hypothetical protein ASD01_03900 [Ensifer sp. Root423]|uniref:hypothetical protein n=1 Tax=Ensifer sp. Root423 TaxID=1736534 RepID=UPI000712E965|nr:hypothetical protein [Ensifer sp. Root423]KQX33073.1 hypothetical protein ASD01_03900 [Ensifer sp. Root423]
MSISFKRLAVVAVVALAFVPGIAQAESYATLTKQGYATGKLSRGKSGAWGWVVYSAAIRMRRRRQSG